MGKYRRLASCSGNRGCCGQHSVPQPSPRNPKAGAAQATHGSKNNRGAGHERVLSAWRQAGDGGALTQGGEGDREGDLLNALCGEPMPFHPPVRFLGQDEVDGSQGGYRPANADKLARKMPRWCECLLHRSLELLHKARELGP